MHTYVHKFMQQDSDNTNWYLWHINCSCLPCVHSRSNQINLTVPPKHFTIRFELPPKQKLRSSCSSWTAEEEATRNICLSYYPFSRAVICIICGSSICLQALSIQWGEPCEECRAESSNGAGTSSRKWATSTGRLVEGHLNDLGIGGFRFILD